MSGRLALRAEAPQAIVWQQLTKGMFDRALTYSTHMAALSAMLPLPSPGIRNGKRRAGYFALGRAGRAGAFNL